MRENVFKTIESDPSFSLHPPIPSLDASLRAPPLSSAPPRSSSPAVGQYLTGDLPGIGGRIRERPEDFLVDEQPLYQPAGTGEHIYMLLEKRNLTTFDLFDIVRKHFGVDTRRSGTRGSRIASPSRDR